MAHAPAGPFTARCHPVPGGSDGRCSAAPRDSRGRAAPSPPAHHLPACGRQPGSSSGSTRGPMAGAGRAAPSSALRTGRPRSAPATTFRCAAGSARNFRWRPRPAPLPGSGGLRFRLRAAVPRWRRWTWTSTWRSHGSASTCPRMTSRWARAGRGGFGRAAAAAGAGGSGTLPVLLVVLPTVLPQRLCDYVCDLLLEESNVQPVSTPVTVCGDIHGQVTARCRDTPQCSVPPPALTCAPSRSSMTCASCSGPAGRCLTPTTSSWYVPVPPCSSQLASGSDPCRVPGRQQHSAFPPPAAALGAAAAAVPGGQSWASRAGLCSDSEPPVGSGGRVLPGRLQPPKETASGFFVHRGVQDRCVALHFSVLVFLHL